MKLSRASLVSMAVVLSFALISTDCKKESNPETTPPPPVEHPPATTVTLILKDSLGTTFVDSCTVRDTSQVHHGEAPVVGQLDLHSGKTYKGTFVLYDETKTPADIITGDIIAEKDAHVFQFRFTGADTTRVVVSGRDLDSHGLPFGLNFTLTVTPGTAAGGNLHVILEHHDDGNKSGTEFDLDLDRDFPVAILP